MKRFTVIAMGVEVVSRLSYRTRCSSQRSRISESSFRHPKNPSPLSCLGLHVAHKRPLSISIIIHCSLIAFRLLFGTKLHLPWRPKKTQRQIVHLRTSGLAPKKSIPPPSPPPSARRYGIKSKNYDLLESMPPSSSACSQTMIPPHANMPNGPDAPARPMAFDTSYAPLKIPLMLNRLCEMPTRIHEFMALLCTIPSSGRSNLSRVKAKMTICEIRSRTSAMWRDYVMIIDPICTGIFDMSISPGIPKSVCCHARRCR